MPRLKQNGRFCFVGLRDRDLMRPDHAAGADAIFDVDLLMQSCPQMLGGDAAQRVGRAAGRKRRDELLS
jgi:hypothetical protein